MIKYIHPLLTCNRTREKGELHEVRSTDLPSRAKRSSSAWNYVPYIRSSIDYNITFALSILIFVYKRSRMGQSQSRHSTINNSSKDYDSNQRLWWMQKTVWQTISSIQCWGLSSKSKQEYDLRRIFRRRCWRVQGQEDDLQDSCHVTNFVESLSREILGELAK